MRAVFQPKNLETLKPHMAALIGHEGEWDESGHMDAGPYEGQTIFHLSRDDPRYRETEALWVPQEDLTPV